MNSKLAKIGGMFIVLLALAALIGSSLTFAQDETPTEPDTPTVEEPTVEEPSFTPNGIGPRGNFGHRGAQLFTSEERDAALADALGITVEELTAARETAHANLIQQAVDAGEITQEQADAILSGEGLRSVMQNIFNKEAIETAVADALGMTTAELEAARAEGKRLNEIAAEQGVELSDVQAAVQAAHEAALQQAVEDGLITQAQADQLQNRPGGFGGHRGGPRGKGGFGQQGNGFGNGFQNQPETPLGENG